MKRVYNFSAGPSALPLEVLQEVQRDMLDYADTGMSITEMSHRSKAFEAVNDEIEASLRELLNVPTIITYCSFRAAQASSLPQFL